MKMLETISKNMSNFTANSVNLCKKHSPEILAVTGVVSVVGGVVVACMTTPKVTAVLEKHKSDIVQINDTRDREDIPEYDTETAKKDKVITYTQTAVKITQLYLPAGLLVTTGLFMLLASNNILRKRNAALAAAYTAVDSAFTKYRKRVSERFGEEIENEIRYNIQTKTVEETIVDEKGNEVVVTKEVKVTDLGASPYARYFEEGNPYWQRDSHWCITTLRQKQSYWNDKLVRDKIVFLNDVYESIGIPRTKEGQIVGWMYDETKYAEGDNYIDFNLDETYREVLRNGQSGIKPVVLLDFNVDGDIWSKL